MPAAQIFGYESYGFNGYYSLQDAPDWASVKGSYGWYIDYYLDQLRLRGVTAGQRQHLAEPHPSQDPR